MDSGKIQRWIEFSPATDSEGAQIHGDPDPDGHMFGVTIHRQWFGVGSHGFAPSSLYAVPLPLLLRPILVA